MRRIQTHMFSEKALAAQEPVLHRYIDKLISKLHEQASKPETAVIDVVRWYNYTTFDVCLPYPNAELYSARLEFFLKIIN